MLLLLLLLLLMLLLLLLLMLLLMLMLLMLLMLLLLDSTRLDIRIKSQGHDCNGKAEPKEPQYKENETLERKSLS